MPAAPTVPEMPEMPGAARARIVLPAGRHDSVPSRGPPCRPLAKTVVTLDEGYLFELDVQGPSVASMVLSGCREMPPGAALYCRA